MVRPLQQDADKFRDLVKKRLRLAKGEEVVCPSATSQTTPCIARDGGLAATWKLGGGTCLGCDRAVRALLEAEEAKHK